MKRVVFLGQRNGEPLGLKQKLICKLKIVTVIIFCDLILLLHCILHIGSNETETQCGQCNVHKVIIVAHVYENRRLTESGI